LRIGTEDSANHRHTVFFKLFVGRHHRQVVQFGGGDDKPINRIVMNRRQFRRRDADIESERKNGQSMMLGMNITGLKRRPGSAILSLEPL
jgi:hypothetical protein